VTTSIKNQAVNKTEGLLNNSVPPLPEAMPAWIKVNSLLLALNSESG
jgi:hypothetical protein